MKNIDADGVGQCSFCLIRPSAVCQRLGDGADDFIRVCTHCAQTVLPNLIATAICGDVPAKTMILHADAMFPTVQANYWKSVVRMLQMRLEEFTKNAGR